MIKKSFLVANAIILSFGCTITHAVPISKGFQDDSRDELIAKFGEEHLRSYQILENSESITFTHKEGEELSAMTFYLENNKVIRFQENDREEMAKQYLNEFASGNLLHNYHNVRSALLNALQKLPLDIYLEVTRRAHPIIFIDYYTNGIAQYAGSLEFNMRETDPPTFDEGFYIIRLGDGLAHSEDVEAIEGIILHEIMHRYLNHLKPHDQHPCELEREANEKLKSLGFNDEFKKASKLFGAKEKGDSPCHDILLELEEKKNSS